MYAIVEIAGQQFKVAKDQKVYVNRLHDEEGSKVSFDHVLMLQDGDNITIGAPAIEGAAVEAKIIRHLRGDKVIVFKKKRRKGYKKKNGHRQHLTQLSIEGILTSGAKKSGEKAEPKKSAPKPETPQKKTKSKDASAKSKEEEVSENLVTRAEHRVEDAHLEINVDKLLHSIGTATKAEADDLKEINGIGPVYEKKLNEVGIYTYEQISKLKASDKTELAAVGGFTRERIDDEEWVKQAKALLKNKK